MMAMPGAWRRTCKSGHRSLRRTYRSSQWQRDSLAIRDSMLEGCGVPRWKFLDQIQVVSHQFGLWATQEDSPSGGVLVTSNRLREDLDLSSILPLQLRLGKLLTFSAEDTASVLQASRKRCAKSAFNGNGSYGRTIHRNARFSTILEELSGAI